ncbi:MAG: hypothetical protein IT430_17940 [Phycisphaerales bacterium]|nr:hypothetical protein [Phycisphaerales bacterium]
MPDTPRKVRLIRRRIIWAALALLTLFLAWQAYDILTGKPRPSVDYATPFYDLVASVQGEGENGWDLYTQTVDHIGETCSAAFMAAMEAHSERAASEDGEEPAATFENVYFPSFDDVNRGPFDRAAWQPHLQIIDSLQAEGSLEALRRVCAMQRFAPPRDTSLTLEEIYRTGPQLSNFRTVCRLNAARMRLSAHDGRWDEFAQVVDESLALANIMSSQATILRQLIAVSLVAMVDRELRCSLVEFDAPASVCRQLREILEARLPLPGVALHLEGERLYQLDGLQRIYTASGRLPVSEWGKHRGDLSGLFPGRASGEAEGALADALAIAIPGHDRAIALTNQVFDEVTEFARRPLTERIKTRCKLSIDVEQLPMNQVLLRENGFSYFDRFIANSAATECETEATIVMLAIEEYRARHGRPPSSLNDLVSDILETAPLDPANGQGYGYRLLTGDAVGRTYLL